MIIYVLASKYLQPLTSLIVVGNVPAQIAYTLLFSYQFTGRTNTLQ